MWQIHEKNGLKKENIDILSADLEKGDTSLPLD